MTIQAFPTRPGHRLCHWSTLLSVCLAGHAAFAESKVAGARWSDVGSSVLKDKHSGLQWTREDNRVDINWIDARAYCDEKQGGWRLPSVEELTAIYDSTQNAPCAGVKCRVSSKFNLSSSWFWSATQVGADATDGIELAWGVLLVTGVRTPSVMTASYGSRALCVRAHR